MLRLPVFPAAALSTLALLTGCGQQQAHPAAGIFSANASAATTNPLLQPQKVDPSNLRLIPGFVSNISVVATTDANYKCPDQEKQKRTLDINSGSSSNHVYACVSYTTEMNTPRLTMLDFVKYSNPVGVVGELDQSSLDRDLRKKCSDGVNRSGQTLYYSLTDLNKNVKGDYIYLCWYTGRTPTSSSDRTGANLPGWAGSKTQHFAGVGDVQLSGFIRDFDFVSFPHSEGQPAPRKIQAKCEALLAHEHPTMSVTVLERGGLYDIRYDSEHSEDYANFNSGTSLDYVYGCAVVAPISALPTVNITINGTPGYGGWFKGPQRPVAQVKVGTEFVYKASTQPRCGTNPPGYNQSMGLRPSTPSYDDFYLSTVPLSFGQNGEGSVFCSLDWPWYIASDEAHVKYDNAAPSVIFSNRHESYAIDEMVDINCIASDNVSGVAKVSGPCKLKGTAGELLAKANIQTSQLPYRLSYEVKATDNAGNESVWHLRFVVQKPDAQSFTNLTNDLVPIVHVAARLSILSTYITYSWTPERKQALVNGYRQYLRDSMKQGVPQHAVDVLSFLVGYL